MEISTVYELQNMEDDLSQDYVLVNDIDCSAADPDSGSFDSGEWSSTGFRPIGNTVSTPFTGTFDGQGYKITNFASLTGNYKGLFGYVESATIQNVGMVDVNVTGGFYVAALVGRSNPCTVSNCWATGVIDGTSSVGGLIGFGQGGTVTNVYCSASVTSTDSIRTSGIVGRSTTTIDKSYFAGVITATGGGEAIADGGTITNSFYDSDVDTNANTTSGGVGKTTVELKDRDTFTDTATTGLDEAWDMADKDVYNDAFVWGISSEENNGYPFLQTFYDEPGAEPEVTNNTFFYGGGI